MYNSNNEAAKGFGRSENPNSRDSNHDRINDAASPCRLGTYHRIVVLSIDLLLRRSAGMQLSEIWCDDLCLFYVSKFSLPALYARQSTRREPRDTF